MNRLIPLCALLPFVGAVTALGQFSNDNWSETFGAPGMEIESLGGRAPAAGPAAMIVDADGNILVVGGLWNSLDGVSYAVPPSYAVWNRDSDQWSPFGLGASAGGVFQLAVNSLGEVYAGGGWSVFVVGTTLMQTQGVVKWDGLTWSALGDGLSGGFGGLVPASAEALAVDANDNLYVGGMFEKAGGIDARNVAKWDGQSWSAMGAGLDSRVGCLTFGPDGVLYAGGVFAEGHVRRVARWDGAAWQPMAAGFTSGEVKAFAFDDEGNVYAGGTFQFISDPNLGINFTRANYVARWDGSVWTPLGQGLNDDVLALAFHNGVLYAGGRFTASGAGAPMTGIAAWNGAEWVAMGDGVVRVADPSPGPKEVTRMVISTAPDDPTSSDLIVCGPFDRAGGKIANNIALWTLGAGGVTPPVRPELKLTHNAQQDELELSFDSEADVTYEVLFSPAVDGTFEILQTLPGTGGEVSHTFATPHPSGGFIGVRASRNE